MRWARPQACAPARYAGPDAADKDNRERVKRELRDLAVTGSTARFQLLHGGSAEAGRTLAVFSGAVEGWLRLEEQGQGGFGYDPLFVPEGYGGHFWLAARRGEEPAQSPRACFGPGGQLAGAPFLSAPLAGSYETRRLTGIGDSHGPPASRR